MSLGRDILSSRTPVESRVVKSFLCPVRGKRSAGLRSDYSQNVAILALGALQARLNELESAVIPQIKIKNRASGTIYKRFVEFDHVA